MPNPPRRRVSTGSDDPSMGVDLIRLHADLAIIGQQVEGFQTHFERQLDDARKDYDRKINEIHTQYSKQIQDIKTESKAALDGVTSQLTQLSKHHQDEMRSVTTAFDSALKETVKNFTDQSKNYVLQVEFGIIRYIVLVLLLGFAGQVAIKYLFKL